MKTLTEKDAIAVVGAVIRACRKSGFTPERCAELLESLPLPLHGPHVDTDSTQHETRD